MVGTANLRNWYDVWTKDDLDNMTNRIDQAKEKSGCSVTSVMEILEILEQLDGMRPAFPLSQQRYFAETMDELIGLAISRLEQIRAVLAQ